MVVQTWYATYHSQVSDSKLYLHTSQRINVTNGARLGEWKGID